MKALHLITMVASFLLFGAALGNYVDWVVAFAVIAIIESLLAAGLSRSVRYLLNALSALCAAALPYVMPMLAYSEPGAEGLQTFVAGMLPMLVAGSLVSSLLTFVLALFAIQDSARRRAAA